MAWIAFNAVLRRGTEVNSGQLDSFTSSISDKSPRIVQGSDSKCVSDEEARRLNLSGNRC